MTVAGVEGPGIGQILRMLFISMIYIHLLFQWFLQTEFLLSFAISKLYISIKKGMPNKPTFSDLLKQVYIVGHMLMYTFINLVVVRVDLKY